MARHADNQLAGFHVTGVDLHPQPNYCGDEFYEADSLEVLGLDEPRGFYARWDFDAIHASPPCQAYSALKARHKDIDHPELIEPVRELLIETGLPYIIENVPGAPLIEPTQICGSGLGLDVRRHRLFESNVDLMGVPCSHGSQAKRFDVYGNGKWRKSATVPVYGTGGGKAGEHWGEAMGIDWMTRDELAEAIPPRYTEHLGAFLIAEVERRSTNHTPKHREAV